MSDLIPNYEVPDLDDYLSKVIIEGLTKLKKSNSCSISNKDIKKMIAGFAPIVPFTEKPPCTHSDVYDAVVSYYRIGESKYGSTSEHIPCDADHPESCTVTKYVSKPGKIELLTQFLLYNDRLNKYTVEQTKTRLAGRKLFAKKFDSLWY